MSRHTRYQGAIVQDDQILLIKHTEHESGRSYWLLPGGGIEDGESEAACVRREMQEETHLRVAVECLLLDEPGVAGGIYQRMKTYLCRVVAGEAQPGYEPEVEASSQYGITEVGWFNVRQEDGWPQDVLADPITYPVLRRVRAALGYVDGQVS
jgi:ADP-ribose pyrophosphatase YjhB (NUDIX family)